MRCSRSATKAGRCSAGAPGPPWCGPAPRDRPGRGPQDPREPRSRAAAACAGGSPRGAGAGDTLPRAHLQPVRSRHDRVVRDGGHRGAPPSRRSSIVSPRRRSGFPLVRAYEIALAVSRCVWHAHRHGVLHRDIKPANVLLPVYGQPAAKLSDFGIARLADVSRATPPGAITGTPRFASPEGLAGRAASARPTTCTAWPRLLYALFSGGQLPHAIPKGASLALPPGDPAHRPPPRRSRASRPTWSRASSARS